MNKNIMNSQSGEEIDPKLALPSTQSKHFLGSSDDFDSGDEICDLEIIQSLQDTQVSVLKENPIRNTDLVGAADRNSLPSSPKSIELENQEQPSIPEHPSIQEQSLAQQQFENIAHNIATQKQTKSVVFAPPDQSNDIDSLDTLFSNPREEQESQLTSILKDKNDQDNDKVDDEPKENNNNRSAFAKILAERLKQNAQKAKQTKKLALSKSIDFSNDEETPSLKIVVPQNQKRKILREQMLDKHSEVIKEEINEEPNQEIQEEEFDDEEEEEEANEEIQKTDIAKTVIEELTKEEKDSENISDEELQHRLYEKVVEMRLSEDLAEIKKIIRIITGQWRSGHFRFDTESLEKAFEGNEQERKELENKRMMRNQRKQKKNEEKAKKLTSENIVQLIEKAMWIKDGNDENASASDVIRGEMAMMSDRDPRKAILERLEMNAFIQEERAKEALKQRRSTRNKHLTRIERTESSGEMRPSGIKVKASEISKKQGSYAFVVNDKSKSGEKSVSSPTTKSPKRLTKSPKRNDSAKKDEALSAFLNKLNK